MKGLTLDELRQRGHRLDEEALRESEAMGVVVERDGRWFWTERAEREFGQAFQTMPAVQP